MIQTRKPRGTIIFNVGVHCLPLILGVIAGSSAEGATKTWSNTGGSNRWDEDANWSGGIPTSIDTALFSTAGSGGTITFTSGNGVTSTANAATLTINSTPNNYNRFEAATGSLSTSTLSFGSGTARFNYAFSTTFNTGDPNFYIGRSRATTGTIITSIGGLLNYRSRFGQGVHLYSTVVGAGSINIGSFDTGTYTLAGLPLGCALVLGAGDQLTDGSLNTNNTFTGGVTLEGFGLLGLGESSSGSPGSITHGPIGTGTLTINGGRIAAFRNGTLGTSVGAASVTIANQVIVNNTLTTLGNIDQEWSGPMTLNVAGVTFSICRAADDTPEYNHTLTLSGAITTTTGSGGLFKGGLGSLRLSADNSSTFAGTITIANGTLIVGANGALGNTGAGNETIVDDSTTDSHNNAAVRLRFESGVNYTTLETIKAKGDGGTAANGAAIYGGDTSPATFSGTLSLLDNTTVQAGAGSSGGLTLNGTIAFDSGTKELTRIGAGTLLLDDVRFNGAGTLNLVISQRITLDPDPLVVNVTSGSTVLNGRVRGGDGVGTFAGLFIKNGSGTFETRYVRVLDDITINGGTLRITADGGTLASSRCATFSIAGGASPTATLDLQDNDLIVNYSGSSPYATMLSQVKAAYTSGTWGGNGITSSMANVGTNALGIGEASVAKGLSGSGTASFSGLTIDATSVLVKYTYYGDANLDGQVDVTDLGKLSANWQMSGHWTEADFNYDDFVDVTDLGALSTNWQNGVGNPLARGSRWQSLYDALQQYPPLFEAAMNDPYLSQLLSDTNRRVPEPLTPLAATITVTASTCLVRRRNRGDKHARRLGFTGPADRAA